MEVGGFWLQRNSLAKQVEGRMVAPDLTRDDA
jgi:hypothetical protein